MENDEHSCTLALMPGTHCQNICDKLRQSTFSSTLKAFGPADITFSALETFCLGKDRKSIL